MPNASSDERPSRHRDHGFVLVFVLSILLVIAVVAASLQLRSRLSARARGALDAHAELTAVADGVARLFAFRLGEQRAGAAVVPAIAVDGRPFTCVHGDALVTVAAQDEAGLISLNDASIEELRRLFEAVGAVDARRLAAAVIDFRDPDDVALPGGAERSAYQAAGLGHGPKNAPLEAVEELDQVFGMTAETLARVLPLVSVTRGGGGVDQAVAPAGLRTLLRLAPQATLPTGAQVRPGERGRARAFTLTVRAERGVARITRRTRIEFSDQSDDGFTARAWLTVPSEVAIAAQQTRTPKCDNSRGQ